MPVQDPPRVFGGLLAFLGAVMAYGGFSLMQQGDSSYFLTAGLGVMASGALIAIGKVMGAWLFALMFAVMVVWSLTEVGADFGQLMPRILLPAVVCIYIFSSRVRPRLA